MCGVVERTRRRACSVVRRVPIFSIKSMFTSNTTWEVISVYPTSCLPVPQYSGEKSSRASLASLTRLSSFQWSSFQKSVSVCTLILRVSGTLCSSSTLYLFVCGMPILRLDLAEAPLTICSPYYILEKQRKTQILLWWTAIAICNDISELVGIEMATS